MEGLPAIEIGTDLWEQDTKVMKDPMACNKPIRHISIYWRTIIA